MSPRSAVKVSAAQRATGQCPAGHDVTEDGALIYSGRAYWCVQCAPPRERWCGRGLHRLGDGVRRCANCARDSMERKALLLVDPPPDVVLNDARCGPETATLFDEVTEDEVHVYGADGVAERIELAKYVCRGCPVRTDCLVWAREHQPAGVFGGEYFGTMPKKVAQTA